MISRFIIYDLLLLFLLLHLLLVIDGHLSALVTGGSLDLLFVGSSLEELFDMGISSLGLAGAGLLLREVLRFDRLRVRVVDRVPLGRVSILGHGLRHVVHGGGLGGLLLVIVTHDVFFRVYLTNSLVLLIEF